MQQTHIILVGGFLGCGKTTLLRRAARNLEARGERVAVITNDQAPNLVDTELLQRDGFAVGEVSGGCFCCRFDALVKCVEHVISANQAGIVLGEPVGSCTDLSATVLQPLKDLYGDRFRLAPLTVLVDPLRLREALLETAPRGFPESVYYIFHKQLEEADAIVINKTDLLSVAELNSLESRVRQKLPRTPVFSMSAKTGAGFDTWLAFVGGGALAGERIAEVDYDVYAEGEAVLGWLNARVHVQSSDGIDLRALAKGIIDNMRKAFKDSGSEPAHVKICLATPQGSVLANLANSSTEPAVQGDLQGRPAEAELLVNARVHMSPESLQALVENSLRASLRDNAGTRVVSLSSFSPSRPHPTHRYSAAV
jgi:Ni2+-binding GTPase involved in maturation of urease and hydrogenase